MKITTTRLLFGRYFEIHLSHDIQLNDQNKGSIKQTITYIIDYISEHLLDYIRNGFIQIKRIHDGFIIKDALRELITCIKNRLTKNKQVIHQLIQSCHEVLSNYEDRADVKSVFHYICRTIKGLLIQYKIPIEDQVILNIRDIDLIYLKMIPNNVIAVVLDDTVDFTVLRYLSNRKIIYILTNDKLNHNQWYYIDPVYRMIKSE